MKSPAITPTHAWPIRYGGPVLLTVLSWTMGDLPPLREIDAQFYDTIVRLQKPGLFDEPKAVCVGIDELPAEGEAEALTELLVLLRAAGSSVIVFASLPGPDPAAFLDTAAELGNVVVGLPADEGAASEMESKRHEVQLALLRRYPAALFGLAAAPPAERGICRRQNTVGQACGVTLEGVEVRATRLVHGSVPPSETYLVRFRGPAGAIPWIPCGRVLSGEIPPAVLKNKAVLVGRASGPGLGSFETPTTAAAMPMPQLEYHANALDTLLGGGAPEAVGRGAALLLHALLVAVSLPAFVIAGPRWIGQVLLALVASWAGMCAALLYFSGWWAPLASPAAAITLLCVASARSQALRESQSLRDLAAEAVSSMKDRAAGAGSSTRDGEWSLILHVLVQTVEAKKACILLRDPRTNGLSMLIGLHCSADDISHPLTSASSSPYRDAHAAMRPLAVPGFFLNAGKSDVQHLVPIYASSELKGFLAMALDAARRESLPDYDEILAAYAARLGEILGGSEARWVVAEGRWGPDEPVDSRPPDHVLSAAIAVINGSLSTAEGAIHSVDTCIMAFDVFGQLLEINSPMTRLLERESIVPKQMTAFDMLMALSEFDATKAKAVLRKVILDQSPVVFPCRFRSRQKGRFMTHVKPMSIRQRQMDRHDSVLPRGILFEIIDTTESALSYELKHRLLDHLNTTIRNKLATISVCASALQTGRGSDQDVESFAQASQTTVTELVDAIVETEQFLAPERESSDFDQFPVRVNDAIRSAMDAVAPRAARLTGGLSLDEPSFGALVLGSAKRLEHVFAAILDYLLEDAMDDSEIAIRVSYSRECVEVEMANAGFGVPDEILQSRLGGASGGDSPTVAEVRDAVRSVGAWGGDVEAGSGVGLGTWFRVRLVRYL